MTRLTVSAFLWLLIAMLSRSAIHTSNLHLQNHIMIRIQPAREQSVPSSTFSALPVVPRPHCRRTLVPSEPPSWRWHQKLVLPWYFCVLPTLYLPERPSPADLSGWGLCFRCLSQSANGSSCERWQEDHVRLLSDCSWQTECFEDGDQAG